MKRIGKMIAAAGLVASLMFAASCADDATIEAMSETVPAYESVITQIDEYTSAYSNYMQTASDNALNISGSDSYTASGVPCYGSLLTTTEGGYKRLTVEISHETYEYIDEYFNISDSMIFIARTTRNDESIIGTVEKYCVIDGVLYSIKDDTDELIAVEQPDTLDFYLSWSEIEEIYAN